MDQAVPYSYQPLADPNTDIRLMVLLPGDFSDAIRIQIFHAPLKLQTQRRQRLTLQEIRDRLPPGWGAHETLQRRFLFFSPTVGYTWTPPYSDMQDTIDDMAPSEQDCAQEPAFEALSYVWGPQDNPETAEVVQSPSASPLRSVLLGKNLASALRHLRRQDRPRTLWVDAVCINQMDNVEKSIQVKRMGALYRSAPRVVAWLGPEEHDSSLAMSALNHLGAQIVQTTDNRIRPSPEATWRDYYLSTTDFPFSPRLWEALCRLFDRPWFERLWIAQEMLLASQNALFQCGNIASSKATFNGALHWLNSKTNLPRQDLRTLVSFVSVAAERVQGLSAGVIIRKYQYRACFDKRDRIYALLGLMPPRYAAHIVADYSNDLLATYKTAFLTHIRLYKRWELFGADPAGRVIDTKPSWIPDFSRAHTTGHSPEYQFSSGFSQLHYVYSEADPARLTVTGLHCATVRTASPVAETWGHELVKQAVRSWEPPGLHGTTKYVTGESLLDVYAITLLQNSLRERHPTGTGSWPTLQEWKDHARGEWWSGGVPVIDTPSSSEASAGSQFMTEMAYDRCRGRKFFTTDNGYIGLGPAGAQQGDLITVILGCDRPVVLRRDQGDDFLFIGDAFVYGLNDAIALVGPLPGLWKAQVHPQPGHATRRLHRFYNPDTGELSMDDPRLGPEPDWERIAEEDLGRELTGDDAEVCSFFRNRHTAEIVDSHPGMLPEALRARGVNLRPFSLV